MKQKLGLACALIHRPRLLLLDEPTGGVDPVTRQDFWQLIIRLLTEGSCRGGQHALHGRSRALQPPGLHVRRADPHGRQPAGTDGVVGRSRCPAGRAAKAAARQVCLADPDVEDVAAFGDRLHLRLREGTALEGPRGVGAPAHALAAAGVHVDELRPVPPSLEDVFIALQVGGATP